MKFKHLIYLGLVLAGSWFGGYFAWRQYVQSFARRLHPPSAEQVRQWAHLSENGHLIMRTPTDVPNSGDVDFASELAGWGKVTSLWAYENCKPTCTNYVVIEVYAPGALLTTNRTAFINTIERLNAQITLELSNTPAPPMPKGISGEPNGPRQDLEEFKRCTAQVTMPDGETSYGFTDGFEEVTRFAFHRRFAVLVYEFIRPGSYDVNHPPADKADEVECQQLYELFTNVNAFLTSQ